MRRRERDEQDEEDEDETARRVKKNEERGRLEGYRGRKRKGEIGEKRGREGVRVARQGGIENGGGWGVGKPWRISAQLHPTVTAAAVSRPRTFVR